MDKLLVSPSPHLHTKTSTKSLMRDVVIALMPAAIISILFYGWSAMLLMAVSIASCLLVELFITRFLLKKPSTIADCSALVTGILLALALRPAPVSDTGASSMGFEERRCGVCYIRLYAAWFG